MTKFELLIVIFLAVIIVTVDVIVIAYLNQKSEDIQVLSEISQIRSGLENFLLINDYYPEAKEVIPLNDVYSGTEKLCLSGFKKLTDNCQKEILNPIPNFYLKQGNIYIYKTPDSQNYQLEFSLNQNLLVLFPYQYKMMVNLMIVCHLIWLSGALLELNKYRSFKSFIFL